MSDERLTLIDAHSAAAPSAHSSVVRGASHTIPLEMRGTTSGDEPLVARSDIYRMTHQATVDAVLGSQSRPVRSEGAQFYNRDRWTLRSFIERFCTWAHRNPSLKPCGEDLTPILREANRHRVTDPEIVIAATPEHLHYTMALALTGGAYHEAWHTLYSLRRDLHSHEVSGPIISRRHRIPNWGQAKDLLLQWTNLIEDVRIERLGIQAFPGAWSKMHYLQDLILQLESEVPLKKRDELFYITVAFRDRALGYETATQALSWDRYVRECPQAVRFVMEGPLRPLLDEARQLGEGDAFEVLRIAIDVVAMLYRAAKMVERPPREPWRRIQWLSDDQEPGEEWLGIAQAALQSAQQSGAAQIHDSASALSAGIAQTASESLRGGQSSERGGRSGQGRGEDRQRSSLRGGRSAQRRGEDNQGGGGNGSQAQENSSRAGGGGPRSERASQRSGGTGWHTGSEEGPQRVQIVCAEGEQRAVHQRASEAVLRGVRHQCAYLRSRITRKMRALDHVGVLHGLRTGRALSEPYLVDTALSVRQGSAPTRAFMQVSDEIDRSMAVALAVDESGSMAEPAKVGSETVRMETIATRLMLTLSDPLDRLNVPTYTFGFSAPRHAQARFRILKGFEERLMHTLYRFSMLAPDGGTPMAEAIEFAAARLEDRDERHRFIFAITDGRVSRTCEALLSAFKRAREAGLHVVGVGMGEGAESVREVFEEHVWAQDLDELPQLLVKKLDELVERHIVPR